MGDIKLFRAGPGQSVAELQGKSVVVERDLQLRMEQNLQEFLGVTFLASEYSTGQKHGGRIDTLGIDENFSPVIIEYKRALNENVINQGLYYLDWLLDHRGEFALLAMNKVPDVQTKINWAEARLICIAAEFTKFDEHAVSQIGRNIELLRYRSFGDDLLLLELVNAATATVAGSNAQKAKQPSTAVKTVSDMLAQSPEDLKSLYQALDAFLVAMGDVQVNVTQQYIAYRRMKNFACVEVHPQARKLYVFVKVEPTPDVVVPGFARDVRAIGHFGTGDLEVTIRTHQDLERAKDLIIRSYEVS